MQHEPIRVLHMIASLEIGGSQSMILNLYKAIDRNKVQFDFIIDHPEEITLKDEVEKLGGKVYVLPTFNGINIGKIRKAWHSFFDSHPEYKIFHTHSRSYASVYLPIAKKHGLITIAHSHSTSNGTGLVSCIKDMMQLPIRYQADYFFACSEEAGEWLFGKKIVTKNNFKVIKNSINSESFRFSSEMRKIVRKELGVSEDEIIIGHVGRIMPPKNHSFLLQIFESYLKKEPNAKLLLIGDGDLLPIVKKEARERKLINNVFFLGAITNPQRYYQAMDVFVFPSSWEGLGISVVEAQASGLKCIVSDRVPRSVDVGAGLVDFVSLSLAPAEWSEMISTIVRRDTSEFILKSGYDVLENARNMRLFYEEIAHEKKVYSS